jgi:hypothetical protein
VTDTDYDPAVYSDSSVGETVNGEHTWRRLTWRELAEERQQEITRLRAWQSLWSDLDRNPNGRHEGDADVGEAGGISQGNPRVTTGDVVGYRLGGKPIIMPPRDKRADPEAWLAGWPA